MITAERRGRLGIEIGIRDDKFLVFVVTTVMPDDGATVAEEMTTGGVAPTAWTEKIYA